MKSETKCKHGHDLTQKGAVYVKPNGTKICRQCKRAAWSKWAIKNGRGKAQ